MNVSHTLRQLTLIAPSAALVGLSQRLSDALERLYAKTYRNPDHPTL